MDFFHRLYRTHQILSSRHLPVARTTLEQELGCQRSTVNRIIAILRDYGAPIDFDAERNGYFYDRSVAFELPGLWFTHVRGLPAFQSFPNPQWALGAFGCLPWTGAK